jgi:HemY protein
MTLGRAVSYFVKLGVLVALAVWLANRPGALTVYWFDHRIDMPVGLAIGLVALGFIMMFALWRLWRIVRAAPREYSIYRANHRQAKGYRALTQGLIAIAAGDPSAARKQAKAAKDLLGEASLPLLLAAQAAQMAGEDAIAERYFEALAQEEETRLLGLRGLAASALKRNDEAAALTICERALALAPQAPWAGETAHRLQLKLGRFDAAETSLKALTRAGTLDAKLAQRRRAALLSEQARRALAEEGPSADLDQAIRNAREAVKMAPDFAPARAVLAQGLMRKGKTREAARLIEQVWDDAPHWSLGRILLSALGDLTPLDRAKRAEAVARRKPDHPDSNRLAAEAAMSAKLWGEARHHLEHLAEKERAQGGLTQDLCRLMARLEMAERYNALTERQWLDQAAQARPSAEWCCRSCGAVSAAGPEAGGWQLICPRCEAIDSLEWKSPETQHWRNVSEQVRPDAGVAGDATAAPSLAATPGGARAAATDPRSGAGFGASVDAARLVN